MREREVVTGLSGSRRGPSGGSGALTERVGKEGVGLGDGERETGVGGSHAHNMVMTLKRL